ncbi:MAG: ABC transporter permease [Magnetococcales bacterium]|nr:ABC transporter permease [Magnetococcales bacterium]
MNAIGTIAFREWRTLFLSPLAWVLLAAMGGINAYVHQVLLNEFLENSMRMGMFGGAGVPPLSISADIIAPALGNSAVILLMLVPLMAMRLIADEKRRESWPALASSPVTPMQIILGKYFGLMLFLLVVIGMVALPPLTLFLFGKPDVGRVAAAFLGLILMTSAFGAVGLAASSMTKNPFVAAVAGFGALLMLWIAAWMGDPSGGLLERAVSYISFVTHFENFLKGVISTGDLAYYLFITALALLFARQRLMAERLSG